MLIQFFQKLKEIFKIIVISQVKILIYFPIIYNE